MLESHDLSALTPLPYIKQEISVLNSFLGECSEQLENKKKDAYQTTTHHLSNKSTNYPTK
jgi:hypothetical protein